MRENFKLRKIKVGLVSVAISMLAIFISGHAEASEKNTDTPTQTKVPLETLSQAKQTPNTAIPTSTQVEQQDVEKTKTQKNFVKLNDVKPGDTQITGKTLPNQIVSLTLDGKSIGSVENGDGGFAESNDSGDFTYDLNDRKVVYNQNLEVTASNFNLESEEEIDEEELEAKTTVSTGRYDKAYEIPTTQLSKNNGHHQVLVEPIIKDSGIIKGHTSVKGRVALAINNQYVNLYDSNEYNEKMSKEAAQSRIEGIWKHIDDKGYFEFDFKRKPLENYNLKKDDVVSLSFKPDDEEEALNPLIFNVNVTDFDNIVSATTSYSPEKVKQVVKLNNVAEDLNVEDIYGYDYTSNHGIDAVKEGSQGTKEIKGKTKFANAVVTITSSLGEGNEFPDLQVNDKGEFSFNASSAGFRLHNGEQLHFTVVNPLTGDILSPLVTKKIDVNETPEQKKEREFDELLENVPAYYQLVGNEIEGYDIHGNLMVYFDAHDKAALKKYTYQG